MARKIWTGPDERGRLAKSLIKLYDQCDSVAPNRNHDSDGTIGDLAHQARDSDHNPSDGLVKALDITHDPVNGMDCHKLAEANKGDHRLGYIIWNRRISNPDIQGGAWRAYNGQNPHTAHVHFSVHKDVDDQGAWNVEASDPSGEVLKPRLQKGSEGEWVRFVQAALGVEADGKFGEATETAVESFQREHDLGVDGIVGPYTWEALLPAKPPTPANLNINIKATVFNDSSLAYGNRPANILGVSLPAPLEPLRKVWIRNRANGLTAIGYVIDKGPWNVDDPYWEGGRRPQAESGTDRKGRKTNLAGIDLYSEMARALGIPFTIREGRVTTGEARVDWGFADELPVPVPDQPQVEAILADIEAVLRKHLEKPE